VAQLLNRIADPPRNAPASSDHVRAIVSRLFRFGISQGIDAIEYNPAHRHRAREARGSAAPCKAMAERRIRIRELKSKLSGAFATSKLTAARLAP
jgi:hypothetical protein